MKNKTTLKTLAAICVLALLVSVLPASVFAEEMVEIPESAYVYINGDSKVVEAQEEMTLLRVTVETAGRFHVLASGVNIKLVLFDEEADEVRGVYSSENGLMDVPFYAAPGMYLIGITGSGEVAIKVADEAETDVIYSGEVVAEVPAVEPAEEVADEAAEESAEEAAEDAEEVIEAPTAEPAEEIAAEPVVEEPAFDASEPIFYQAAINETASLLPVLQEAGVPTEAITYVSGDTDGKMVSSADSVNLGNWLLTPFAYFDSIALTVKTVEDVDYTVIVSCPAPVEEAEPAEASAEEAAEPAEEAPAEEAEEAPAEEPVEEAPAEEAVEPAEEVPEEEPVEAPVEEAAEPVDEAPVEEAAEPVDEAPAEEAEEAPAEEPEEPAAEEPVENNEDKQGFFSWLFGGSQSDEKEEEPEEEPAEEVEAEPAEEPEAEPAEDIEEVEAEPAEEVEAEPAEELYAEPAAEADEEAAEEPADETPAEEPAEDPSELSIINYQLSISPIVRQVSSNEQITLLPILTEAGAPVNTITNVTGEVDGKLILVNQGNGDWVITPFAYFDSIELTVTATDYLAADPAAAEAVFTVILTNPDPNPVVVVEPAEEVEEVEEAEEVLPEEPEAEEPAEGAEVVEETTEPSEEALLTTNYSSLIDSVTIAVDRQEDNAIRLFAENIAEEEGESYAYQWQYSPDGEEWFDVEGATEKDYNFQLDDTNGRYYWRLIVSYM